MTEIQHTFSMIKPDATKRDIIGLVNAYIEEAGLKIVAQKMIQLTEAQAKEFYAEHVGKPFFDALVTNITAGPVVVQVLEGVDAIAKNRKTMGTTNPDDAEEGTIRGDLGEDINFNTVHGSDSQDSAKREISFFFTEQEIFKSK